MRAVLVRATRALTPPPHPPAHTHIQPAGSRHPYTYHTVLLLQFTVIIGVRERVPSMLHDRVAWRCTAGHATPGTPPRLAPTGPALSPPAALHAAPQVGIANLILAAQCLQAIYLLFCTGGKPPPGWRRGRHPPALPYICGSPALAASGLPPTCLPPGRTHVPSLPLHGVAATPAPCAAQATAPSATRCGRWWRGWRSWC